MTTVAGLYGGLPRPMTSVEFKRLSEFIRHQCGIRMPPGKKVMLEARLQKRLRSRGLSSFGEYCEYLLDSPEGGAELVHMIDAITTNKTDFFREPVHFRFLSEVVLPEYTGSERQNGAKKFSIWSAGCSTGEEPYTIAMVLAEFAGLHPGLRFSILATDISTRALEAARSGIYNAERIETVPLQLIQKYIMRSKDRKKGLVRITPELRALVQFQRLNLLGEDFAFSEQMDAVFCRNVIIYFERGNQERLLRRLCKNLKTGGYLFLGHSETVHGYDLPLNRMSSTVYRKAV